MSSESENHLGITRESIPPKKRMQSNVIRGNNFRSLPVHDLSQTGEGPTLGDEPVNVEELTRTLNQLEKDSRGYRRPRRSRS
ncbi:hypothetical protein A2867_04665 [Candidatus Daviesbacteria bacterium RIFCSPHIGHO2_01_FULL_40_11]|uniref:Uncharacterized protein n=1 Tax=Candidatus Daviesbacteria bacterium RIFCSPHIGHO2_01_FULL_40_11 TaxID=1797762 RepID=A0A1F5JJE8_9BACT|nr:MAG: hypothetical protein A2867_04665 [Candidatus Daviesbacteria bacterium RIFCSPHIGHO2_01_FULL_40_11]OGE62754.1 MAG: hypothetical protein A2964_00530 [Candidatus Daviesbacteria bacterium RIFCSPLOWO2_01_FULL_40_27]